jgi:prolyl 4-hydroxylase
VMQGQRYLAGQQFKHHYDYFTLTEGYWQQERRRGGQRSWTAMVFLNEPEAGGATDFPALGVALQPEAGAVAVWNNMARDGQPNPNTLHAGMPVERGEKYVITQWFRLEPWTLHLR